MGPRARAWRVAWCVMDGRRRARLVSRIAGAALLGAATILIPKADPTQHWATPVDVVVVVESEQAPDPGRPRGTFRPVAPPVR